MNYYGWRTRRNICASTRVGCMLLGVRMLRRLLHDYVLLLGMWATSWLIKLSMHDLVTVCCQQRNCNWKIVQQLASLKIIL